MAIAVKLRADYAAAALRRLAARTKTVNQRRRLLSLAAVQDGMDRQTLRDWVQRFNAHGPDGLKDAWSKGNPPRLLADQQRELAALVEAGPNGLLMGLCAGGGSICNA